MSLLPFLAVRKLLPRRNFSLWPLDRLPLWIVASRFSKPSASKHLFAGEIPNRANTIKFAGNFLISSMLQGFGEAFALARKSGIEAEKLLEILTGTVFVAPYQKGYGSSIARGVYEPAGFTASLGLKDVRLVLAAADAAGVPMPMASLVHDRFQTALGRGHGAKDWSVIARLAAEDAGL